ncbi:MAG: hypothetical protein V8Q82_02880 [Christensenellales bacterium]
MLEFTKILDMLASFAVTDMGREACEKLTPLSDLAQVNEALEETEEAQVILTYLPTAPADRPSRCAPVADAARRWARRLLQRRC